jgi:hypothetical protein
MKHVKLFEAFVNEGKYPYMGELIELLSDVDAMDMAPDEFVDQCVRYYKLDNDLAADIFDAYWSLGAKDRFHFTEKDWEKFLNKQGLK